MISELLRRFQSSNNRHRAARWVVGLAGWQIILCCTLADAQTPVPAVQTPVPPVAAPTVPSGPPAFHTTASGPEFRKGVLYGRVVDLAGKPVVGATVALQDKNAKVLAWSKTNAMGEYAIAADPMDALSLRPSRRRGLLEQCARGVAEVVIAPIKIAGAAVANPANTIKSAAVSVATGTPVPLLATTVVPGVIDRKSSKETAKSAVEVAAQTAVGGGRNSKHRLPLAEKGEVMILVTAPTYKDAKGKAEAFWLEGPILDKEKPLGMQAWLESVKLAPVAGDAKSEVIKEAVTLAEPVIEPTLAVAGGTVKIRIKLLSPPGPERKLRVFARETRKDIVAELTLQPGLEKNVYSGTMVLDPKTPIGETAITIAALRTDPVEVKLDKKKDDPLIGFVRQLDDMDSKKPYEYDPRIMASQNRLDLKLMVLDAKKQTAVTPSSITPPEVKK